MDQSEDILELSWLGIAAAANSHLKLPMGHDNKEKHAEIQIVSEYPDTSTVVNEAAIFNDLLVYCS